MKYAQETYGVNIKVRIFTDGKGENPIFNFPLKTLPQCEPVYVIGFSMGGSTVMNAISKRPDLFAAAINVSGISDFSNMENLKNLPIRIIHGGLDTDNRPESNVKFYNEMKDVGNIFFFKYKDRYHNNILSSEAVASIAEWLSLEKLKKRK